MSRLDDIEDELDKMTEQRDAWMQACDDQVGALMKRGDQIRRLMACLESLLRNLSLQDASNPDVRNALGLLEEIRTSELL